MDNFKIHTSSEELYFEQEPDYDKIREKIEFLDIYSQMDNQSIYIIDFYKHGYFYYSDSHFFKIYYNLESSQDEALASKLIMNKDKQRYLEIKDTMFSFTSAFDVETQKNMRFFSARHFKLPSGNVITISNQYQPILFDDHGKIWMMLGSTRILDKSHPTGAYIDFLGTQERYVYVPSQKKFVLQDTLHLSEREESILIYSSQGYTSKEIAEMENISINTVKFHRKNILSRFSVKTIQEAISLAHSHHLIYKKIKYTEE